MELRNCNAASVLRNTTVHCSIDHPRLRLGNALELEKVHGSYFSEKLFTLLTETAK